jgi:hypothetical protein
LEVLVQEVLEVLLVVLVQEVLEVLLVVLVQEVVLGLAIWCYFQMVLPKSSPKMV